MPLFQESEVRARAKRGIGLHKSTASVLSEHVLAQSKVAQHDIFLSHAYEDKELVLGVALMIEDLGYTVYLDWRDDPTLDRKRVTKGTAEKLRARMKTSRCLFYSTTDHASDSKWMPWELGYKDGQNNRSAILPVSSSNKTSFSGQEYLGIYPYVTHGPDTNDKLRLWIRQASTCYVSFDEWLNGVEPKERG